VALPIPTIRLSFRERSVRTFINAKSSPPKFGLNWRYGIKLEPNSDPGLMDRMNVQKIGKKKNKAIITITR
jgi:hypothetical protein